MLDQTVVESTARDIRSVNTGIATVESSTRPKEFLLKKGEDITIGTRFRTNTLIVGRKMEGQLGGIIGDINAKEGIVGCSLEGTTEHDTSRIQAKIFVRDKSLVVQNLSTSLSIVVNGKRVPKAQKNEKGSTLLAKDNPEYVFKRFGVALGAAISWDEGDKEHELQITKADGDPLSSSWSVDVLYNY